GTSTSGSWHWPHPTPSRPSATNPWTWPGSPATGSPTRSAPTSPNRYAGRSPGSDDLPALRGDPGAVPAPVGQPAQHREGWRHPARASRGPGRGSAVPRAQLPPGPAGLRLRASGWPDPDPFVPGPGGGPLRSSVVSGGTMKGRHAVEDFILKTGDM